MLFDLFRYNLEIVIVQQYHDVLLLKAWSIYAKIYQQQFIKQVQAILVWLKKELILLIAVCKTQFTSNLWWDK